MMRNETHHRHAQLSVTIIITTTGRTLGRAHTSSDEDKTTPGR